MFSGQSEVNEIIILKQILVAYLLQPNFFMATCIFFSVSLETLGIMIPQRVQKNMKRKKRQKKERERKTGKNPRVPQATLISQLQVEMKRLALTHHLFLKVPS